MPDYNPPAGSGSGDAVSDVEGEATLDLTGDVTIAAGKDFTVDTDTLHVDASNDRVGVGTTSPASTLEVVESSSSLYGLIVDHVNGQMAVTQYGGIHLDNHETSPELWQISERDSKTLDFAYGTPDSGKNVGASNTQVRVTSGGNVGIGLGSTDPSAKLDVDGTFRSPRLLTVSLSSNTTLSEDSHAGRYLFVTGSSRTITLGANTADVAAGIHYTLVSNDSNGFTLTSTKNLNGSSDDITVSARNAVTVIADGSNYVVLGA
jgi:hypothetical protein